MHNLENLFHLDPDVVFLNHGSFGATPKPVFAVSQDWQLRMEHQPVLFLGRELDGLLLKSRWALGNYLNADPDDLVYIPNATHGVNIVARSLRFESGDEVLTTDHEYGACDYTWDFVTGRNGVRYIHQHIPLPVQSGDEIIERFWAGVTPRTKVIYLSYITSTTALRLPVGQICKLARQKGILTVIDAAHAPGQIQLDLQALDADIVFGNCHKWMMSAKGAAFLYVRKELQPLVDPLIISWGYNPAPESTTGSRFIDILQWTGTKDPTAALTVPAAIEFMQRHNWDRIREDCHALLKRGIERICDLVGMPPLYPLDLGFFKQMGIAPLPMSDLPALKRRLYDEYRIEVPIVQWGNRQFIRISVQGYNNPDDIDKLVYALKALLPQVSGRSLA